MSFVDLKNDGCRYQQNSSTPVIPTIMSALGHKRTYAVQNGMSALPPIATAKADFRKRPCLLYPQKRTWAVQQWMSAMGQKRTCAIHSITSSARPSSAGGKMGPRALAVLRLITVSYFVGA